MLPPGHIAAGYLTAEVLLKITRPDLPAEQINQLILWGMFFGFAPDLDMFYAFFKEKAFIVKDLKNHNHRKYYSHAPILWLGAGLLICFLAPSAYVKFIGLMLWLGSWTHFLLDSVEYGIMWLWPFSSKVYALKDPELVLPIYETRFIPYWWQSVKQYAKFYSFYLEVLIIITALIIYYK